MLDANIFSQKKRLTIKELCEKYNVSRAYIYQRTSQKAIPHYKLCNRLFFDVEEIEAYFKSQTRRIDVLV